MRSDSILGRLAYTQTHNVNYLIYTLLPEDHWCDFQSKMLSQNLIEGVLKYHHFALDGRRELHFELNGLIALDVYLSRKEPTAHGLAQLMLQILDVFARSAEYLLDCERFLMAIEHTYIDLSTMRVFLLYIPIIPTEQSQDMAVNTYLQSILYGFKGKMKPELSVLVNTLNGLLREPFPSFESLRIALMAAMKEDQNPSCYPEREEARIPLINSPEKELQAKIEKPAFKPIGPVQKKRQDTNPIQSKGKGIAIMTLMLIDGCLLGLILWGWTPLLQMTGGPTTNVIALTLLMTPIHYYGIRAIGRARGTMQPGQKIHRQAEVKRAAVSIDLGFNSEQSADKSGKHVPKVKAFSKIKSSERIVNLDHGLDQRVKPALIVEKDKAFFQGAAGLAHSMKTELLRDVQTSSAYLVELGGQEKILIESERFMIGRQSDLVDLCLSDSTVGRIHAEIRHSLEASFIVDLNSKNGTRVNDQRLVSNVPFALKEGDCIVFSNKAFYFRCS